ncbi:hypothetical protein FBY02_103212 [Pseudomonas sp. SJZ078]|nr:hypothetical protein [Pseudomonas sp. SJZ078]TWC36676.1 hypothetical protein FBY02_103212 [Pseudomonas sp. SJZ078]
MSEVSVLNGITLPVLIRTQWRSTWCAWCAWATSKTCTSWS